MACTYKEFLETDEWKEKKQKVKERDICCQNCWATEGIMDVHHVTYQHGWNCDIKYLELLCRKCHTQCHKPKNCISLEELHKKIENWNPYAN